MNRKGLDVYMLITKKVEIKDVSATLLCFEQSFIDTIVIPASLPS